MKKRIRLSAIMLLLLLVTTVLPVPASANAAEPPGLTVLVTNSPQYLELSLRFPDGTQATEVQLNSSNFIKLLLRGKPIVFISVSNSLFCCNN